MWHQCHLMSNGRARIERLRSWRTKSRSWSSKPRRRDHLYAVFSAERPASCYMFLQVPWTFPWPWGTGSGVPKGTERCSGWHRPATEVWPPSTPLTALASSQSHAPGLDAHPTGVQIHVKAAGLVPNFRCSFLGRCDGFGGVIRAGRLGQVPVVTKQLHRDPDNEDFFKELYIGLWVPASPVMGFALGEDETPRLVSAKLDETAHAFLRRGDATFARRKHLAVGMLLAVEGLAGLGLVHCDLKPDNFMMDGDAVFLIDFGSVCQEGATPPMTCQLYCPPDSVVTLAWDIFSLGQILLEIFGGMCPEMGALHSQMCCGVASRRPSSHSCLEFVLAFEPPVVT